MNIYSLKIASDMKGINYVVDADGNKTAVQIDLHLYGELWQDFYDLLLIESAKDEESDSLEAYLEKLEKKEQLDEQVQSTH